MMSEEIAAPAARNDKRKGRNDRERARSDKGRGIAAPAARKDNGEWPAMTRGSDSQ